MPQQYSFGVDPVTTHVFNGDGTQLALSLNSHEVFIYTFNSSTKKWDLKHTLQEHMQHVTSIDWEPNSNKIVSCGADRNAYVWKFDQSKKEWIPSLVLLRINRAATCVRWSPSGDKFAVGSGARLVSVCYFEAEQHWWVSRLIKKPIRSTVLCIDWHPNNILLACGSSDYKTRVFSAYVKEVEKKPGPNSWGSRFPFAELVAEFPAGKCSSGWIHSVSFSHSGDQLCWVGHDSSISVVDAANGMKYTTIRTEFRPFLSSTWLSDKFIAVGGHDCCPMLYQYTAEGLQFVTKLDLKTNKGEQESAFSARRRFQAMEKRAVEDEESYDLDTLHKNSINQLTPVGKNRKDATQFSTSALDGQVIIWDMESLSDVIAALKL